MNIVRTLEKAVIRWPERIAITDLDAPGGRQDISYAAFWTKVLRVASALTAHGLTRGDRIALMTRNSHEYLEAYYGAVAAGLVVVPLNIRLLEDELAHILKDTGTSLLFAEQSLLREKPALAALPARGVVELRPEGPSAHLAWADFLARGSAPATVVDVEPETLLSLIYTSGTTGLPKGVMLAHRAWQRAADDAIHELRYEETHENTLTASPITHGVAFYILPTFATGGRNVLCGTFAAARVLQIFKDERITNIHLVPTMIRLLLDANTAGERIGPHLKALTYAGAVMDVPTIRESLAAFGPVLLQSFGQMEFPMFMTVLDQADHVRGLESAPHLLGAVGRPVRDMQVRIVADDGSVLPVGEIGEIAGKGPLAMLGYWNRPDATADTFRDGWVHTGDLGRLDEEGYLYVAGRKKDMIISGGMNVYAREVEEVLLAVDGVKDAAVIGIPDRLWGEAVVAVLIRKPGATVRAAEVIAQVRPKLPDYRRPKDVRWIDEFPKNAYGKVLKRVLRDRFTELPTETPSS